jgi:hypothetical protein
MSGKKTDFKYDHKSNEWMGKSVNATPNISKINVLIHIFLQPKCSKTCDGPGLYNKKTSYL